MRQTELLLVIVLFVMLQIAFVSEVGATVRIMPLGNSITNGNSSGVVPSDPAYYVSYRKVLWDKLVAAAYEIDFVGSLNSGSAIFGASDPADHEGHPGWRDDEILNGRVSEPEKGKLIQWLITHQPDVVLLHVGTNWLESHPDDVEAILDVVDLYSADVWVVLARIINQSCITHDPPCSESIATTLFNDNIMAMAQSRIDNLGDRIQPVDMEDSAGINYLTVPGGGDMWDNLHPFETGYSKMADAWFNALEQILPSVAGTNVMLDYIEIEGPPVLDENSEVDYYCRAYYTNGTDRLIMADIWDEDSPNAVISSMGRFATTELSSDETVTIFASYAEGIVTSNNTYDVVVKNLRTSDLNLSYSPVTPCRIVDTRLAGGAIPPGGIRSYNVFGTVASQGGNPDGCPSPGGEPRAVHVNVTAVPMGTGNIGAFPFRTTAPTASLVNYRAVAQNVANSGTVKTCFNCAKDIHIQSNAGAAHVVIDVLGYYYSNPFH